MSVGHRRIGKEARPGVDPARRARLSVDRLERRLRISADLEDAVGQRGTAERSDARAVTGHELPSE